MRPPLTARRRVIADRMLDELTALYERNADQPRAVVFQLFVIERFALLQAHVEQLIEAHGALNQIVLVAAKKAAQKGKQ